MPNPPSEARQFRRTGRLEAQSHPFDFVLQSNWIAKPRQVEFQLKTLSLQVPLSALEFADDVPGLLRLSPKVDQGHAQGQQRRKEKQNARDFHQFSVVLLNNDRSTRPPVAQCCDKSTMAT